MDIINTASAKNSLEEQQVKSIERMASSQSLNAPNVNKEEKLREACEGFEAIFIQKMWEGMRASLPKDGMMHSKDEQFWQGMYDQELGKSMASAGGIGLANMMMSQLSRNLHNASEVAATNQGRTPMSIEPVPLIPPKQEEPVAVKEETVEPPKLVATANPVTTATPTTNDIYSGEAVQPEAPKVAEETETAKIEQPTTPPVVQAQLNEFATQVKATEVNSVVMAALQEAQAKGQQITHITTYSQGLQPKRTNREPSRFANRVDPNNPVVTGRRRNAQKVQEQAATQPTVSGQNNVEVSGVRQPGQINPTPSPVATEAVTRPVSTPQPTDNTGQLPQNTQATSSINVLRGLGMDIAINPTQAVNSDSRNVPNISS